MNVIFSPPTIEEKVYYDYDMPPICDDYDSPTLNVTNNNDFTYVESNNSFMHVNHEKMLYVMVMLLSFLMILLKVIMREGSVVI